MFEIAMSFGLWYFKSIAILYVYVVLLYSLEGNSFLPLLGGPCFLLKQEIYLKMIFKLMICCVLNVHVFEFWADLFLVCQEMRDKFLEFNIRFLYLSELSFNLIFIKAGHNVLFSLTAGIESLYPIIIFNLLFFL